jgi:hypothetical protein
LNRRSRYLYIATLLATWLVPCPSRGQDTAYHPQDAQIPGPATPSDFPSWLADLKHWRGERWVRMGYDGTNYARPELQWTQHNFVCVQMMVEERDFYDRGSGAYTVDHYLDGLKKEFGGIDSVLIWDTYPNLGVDNRNQFDRLRRRGAIPTSALDRGPCTEDAGLRRSKRRHLYRTVGTPDRMVVYTRAMGTQTCKRLEYPGPSRTAECCHSRCTDSSGATQPDPHRSSRSNDQYLSLPAHPRILRAVGGRVACTRNSIHSRLAR